MAGNLSATLNEYRRRCGYRLLMLAVLRGVTVNLVLVVLALLLDNLAGLAKFWRLLLLLGWGGGNLAAMVAVVRRWRRERRSDRAAAVELEHRCGIRDNALVNAVCLRTDPAVSPALRQAFIRRADVYCHKIVLSRFRFDRRCRRRAMAALGLMLLSLLYFLPFWRYAGNAWQRYLQPWSTTAALNFTRFTVDPGDATVGEGGDLTIRATAERGGRSLPELKIRIKGTGVPILCNLVGTDGRGEFTLHHLTAPVTYAICGGRDVSREFTVTVKPRPRPEHVTIRVVPPAYTALRPTEYDAKTRTIAAPAGSTVTVTVTPPPGVTAGLTAAAGKDAVPVTAPLVLERDVTMTAWLRDAAGNRYDRVWSAAFRVLPDRPPQVRFLNRDANLAVLAGRTVPLGFAADDDFGISRLQLVALVNGQTVVLKKFHYEMPVAAQIREAYRLQLDPSRFPPDSTVELRVIAADNQPSPPHVVTSNAMTIHVLDPLAALRENAGHGDNADRVYRLLFRALDRQQSARNWLAERMKNFHRGETQRVVREQQTVDNLLQQAATATGAMSSSAPTGKRLNHALVTLRQQQTAPLLGRSRTLSSLADMAEMTRELNHILL
ncbi:MAG: hypothetical protein PHQ27_10640, partial [Victivallales bacterium]|nr:hypothetical protein [Victivallales bacterium]